MDPERELKGDTGRNRSSGSPVLPSKSKLRHPSDQERKAPRPCDQRTERKSLPVDSLEEQNRDGIDKQQQIDQHQGIVRKGLSKLSPAKRKNAPVRTRRWTRNTGHCPQDGRRNLPRGNPRNIPNQVEDECAKGKIAGDEVCQALLTPHEGHVHTSCLQPSITNGSQQIGKQQSSKTANKTHPPVDNPFFCMKGAASWPQNGHCGVKDVHLSYQLKSKVNEMYQRKTLSVNWYKNCQESRAPKASASGAPLGRRGTPEAHSALSICALCSLSE